MWNWIVQNQQWVFSGIGATVVGAMLAYFLARPSNNQSQKSGNNSVNIQSGRDLNIK